MIIEIIRIWKKLCPSPGSKKRDGHMNRYKTTEQNINGTTIEKLENYDKGEQIMI